ncbi:leucine--tRNA ligase, partial [Candidatus Beckwithbacteria bacterium CG_4_10_14_0_2_um_filter_47_25]
YYKWTQWLFVRMFNHGLAYRKKASVNWCPSCKTVLADEQVIEGQCERCNSVVEKRATEQWFFRITEYADRLLNNLKKINWPEKIKTAQRHWIGRKEGINITYQVEGSDPSTLPSTVTVFTTAPVNFGATFIVVGPEHNLAQEAAKKDKKVKEYITKALEKSEIDRIAEGRKKTGAFTGFYAINHVTKKEIPIYVTDFVLGHVGTGAVQGCPGHDRRDFEFAKQFKLPIPRVIVGEDGYDGPIKTVDQVVEHGMKGTFVNSEFLNGLDFEEGLQKTMDYFEEKGWGKRVVTFRLRDWCISRQRYWGSPIPMIFCKNCGWYPEENLPVKLPYLKNFKPTDDGKPPLERAEKSWLFTKCPKCGGQAKRETEVSDTFLDSSWYFLRYPSVSEKVEPKKVQPGQSTNKVGPFDAGITRRWLPVDAYIGGAEHAVLHLLYSRFVWMALQDWGFIPKKLGDEPFPFLYGHGLIIKDGFKMSKSRGNIVNPDEYLDKYGADVLRMYLMFIGPYDQGGDFRDTGMKGMSRFLTRVEKLVSEKGRSLLLVDKVRPFQHQTIKRVTAAMKNLRYNVAIAALMEYVNGLEKEGVNKDSLKALLLMLAPLAPFTSEELWEKLGGKFSIHQQLWPKFEEKLAAAGSVTVVIQVNGKLRKKAGVSLADSQNKTKMIALAKELTGRKNPLKEIFVPGRLVNLVVDWF